MQQETTIEAGQQPTQDEAAQDALKQGGRIPKHIAIIMDGNGRWAKGQGKMRVFGHYEGVESVRDITEACAQLGVEYLTLYTFSTENWHRPTSEVEALMTLLIHSVRRERNTLLKNNIRLNAIGDINLLPAACQKEFEACMADTAQNTRMTLNLALSYSGRWDLVEATRAIAERVKRGELNPDEVDEQTISDHLSTRGMPDPDLLIRTGGELRISNFLLWEIAYTELYITEDYWPAFRRDHLYRAIEAYQQRDRRFGRVKL